MPHARRLALAALTGIVTGLVVAAFEAVTDAGFEAVLELPLAARAAMPLAGLVGSFALLRWVARGATPATADEYIRAFHDEPTRHLDRRPIVGRLLASVMTLGTGGALGHEGPAIYAGAAVGDGVQRRARLGLDDAKVLLVAGAAAGVAAVFKAPVTGLVFALEVPYQDDLARRMLLPAATASAAGYVTFAAFAGTEPLLPVAGQPPFSLVDLGGAAAVGLGCGLLARCFAWLVARAKDVASRRSLLVAVAAGVLLAAAAVAGWEVADRDVTLGAGYDAIRWALSADDMWLLAAVGSLRVVAILLTLGGGGVGGLFVPLVVQGAFVGQAVTIAFDPPSATLFPVLGIAAFLGAGYHVPLAAVVFVAELTGRPGFVVPGLIAAVVAQLAVGRASVSPYQTARRAGHLEGRLQLPVAAIVDTECRVVPSDATVEEAFWQHLVATRTTAAPVVDRGRYVGLLVADELHEVDRELWSTTLVGDVVRRDVPRVAPTSTVGEAVQATDRADVDRIAVCDGDRFVGIVRVADAVALGDLFDRTSET